MLCIQYDILYIAYYVIHIIIYVQRETHPTQQSNTSTNNASNNNNTYTTIHEPSTTTTTTTHADPDSDPVSGAGAGVHTGGSGGGYKSTDDSSDCSNMSTTSIIPEERMPELWLPGRILHLYTYRGQYRISRVSRTYTSLRTIEVQGNMFSDHTSNDIFDALLEARAVYNAPAQPPVWQAYDRTDRCACCKSTFTWHSTFRGMLTYTILCIIWYNIV